MDVFFPPLSFSTIKYQITIHLLFRVSQVIADIPRICFAHNILITYLPPATKLGQGNIFRSVCQQFCPQGGGVHGCTGGMCGFIRGGLHAWFYWGGMHGFIQQGGGRMRGFFSFSGYNEIRSMSGRYASYWNAFLLLIFTTLLHFS